MGACVKARIAVRVAEVIGYLTIAALTFAMMYALLHVIDTITTVYQAVTGD
jgi:hypothetical protein